MDIQTVLIDVENTQAAKTAAAGKLVTDQANGDAKSALEAARLLAFADTIKTDSSSVADATTAADKAVDGAISFLQSLKSTAAPVPAVV